MREFLAVCAVALMCITTLAYRVYILQEKIDFLEAHSLSQAGAIADATSDAKWCAKQLKLAQEVSMHWRSARVDNNLCGRRATWLHWRNNEIELTCGADVKEPVP